MEYAPSTAERYLPRSIYKRFFFGGKATEDEEANVQAEEQARPGLYERFSKFIGRRKRVGAVTDLHETAEQHRSSGEESTNSSEFGSDKGASQEASPLSEGEAW